MNIFNPALIAQALLVPVLAPLLIGLIRKIKASFQNREGASVLQPYRDLWKLFHKDEVISKDSSVISRVAPYVVFVTSMVVALGMPIIVNDAALPVIADMLTIIYVLALGVFFLALNGLDVGGGFGGLGSSREMTLAACTEGGFLFSLLLLGIVTGSTNLIEMTSGSWSVSFISIIPLILGIITFFIVLISENARIPFDNPSTHLELTMVHEAMILESSGKSLALLEWGSWSKLFVFLTILANVFLPWGIAATGASFAATIISLAIFLLKIFVFAFVIAVVESSIAKLRYFRLPDVLFGAMILSIIGIAIVIH